MARHNRTIFAADSDPPHGAAIDGAKRPRIGLGGRNRVAPPENAPPRRSAVAWPRRLQRRVGDRYRPPGEDCSITRMPCHGILRYSKCNLYTLPWYIYYGSVNIL